MALYCYSRQRGRNLMLETIFWIVVGAFIGWHVPQPAWAQTIKDKVVGLIKGGN